MNFIEIITREIGKELQGKIGISEDACRLSKQVVDKEGRSLYVYNGREILLSDTKKYQAFHIQSGDALPVKAQENPFSNVSQAMMLNIPCSFLLFGFTGKEESSSWKVLECFNNKCYAYTKDEETLVSADVSFSKFNFNPAQVARKYFQGKWPGIVHKQLEMTALEIQYNMKVSTCEYCFE